MIIFKLFNEVDVRPFELEIKLPQTSMEMQRKKYKRNEENEKKG
jgi:hypothetical protein